GICRPTLQPRRSGRDRHARRRRARHRAVLDTPIEVALMATTLPTAPQSYSPRKKRPLGRFIIYVLLIAATLFYLMPVYVMVVNGLKDKSYMSLPDMWKLPLYLDGGGFPVAWETLSPNLWASLRMVVPATILSSLLGAVNGYLLSKWKFRG